MRTAELADHRLNVTVELPGLKARPVGMVGQSG
jgi:hypothetical protein